MNNSVFALSKIRPLTHKVFELTLAGDTSDIIAPGQFVMLSLPGRFLRRPFSVCDRSPGRLFLLVERVGVGTEQLLSLPLGTELEVLTGLGNGFSLSQSGSSPLLVAGGTGTSPLYFLAKEFKGKGVSPAVRLGFRTGSDAFYMHEFRTIGIEPAIYTEDGSLGTRGRATDGLETERCSRVYACGPEAMLHTVSLESPVPSELAFDVRMGCGFGVCMGCSRKTVYGMKRVCHDGPVFLGEELIWDA